MRKYLTGLFLALGISALFIPGVQAQLTGAGTGIRTVVSDLIEWTGTQKFRDDVTVGGTLTVTGAQTNSGVLTGDDVAAVDDLTVGDDAVVTGDLTVTGVTDLNGVVNSPIAFGAASQTQFVSGKATLTEAGAAETVFTVTTATTQNTGGHLYYTVRIQDTAATPDDNAVRVGHFQFALSNSAGTVICTADASDQTNDDSHIEQQGVAKTITYAIAATAGSNSCVVSFDLDSDMATVTGASIDWYLVLQGPGTVS